MDWQGSVTDHGYGLVPNVFGKDEILGLLEQLRRDSLPRSRAGVRHAMKSPAIARLSQDSRATGIARAILGASATPFRATLFEKLPDSNWLIAWHQDTALPLSQRRESPGWGPWSVKGGVIYAHAPAIALEQVVALRVHLDNSTTENGPLRVLPGTQTRGVLTDKEIHQLAEMIAPVDCLMPLGGIVAMRPLVIHASSKSQTDAPRRVVHIEYAKSARPAEGLELAIV
jgi:ectoine hydroxylase-related dioxygenase (phytanoyl-CoA dioxygenase family)